MFQEHTDENGNDVDVLPQNDREFAEAYGAADAASSTSTISMSWTLMMLCVFFLLAVSPSNAQRNPGFIDPKPTASELAEAEKTAKENPVSQNELILVWQF